MWLKVVKSNYNPLIPATFYVETVKKLGCCSEYLKTDCGTENGVMADHIVLLHQMEMLILTKQLTQTNEFDHRVSSGNDQ